MGGVSLVVKEGWCVSLVLPSWHGLVGEGGVHLSQPLAVSIQRSPPRERRKLEWAIHYAVFKVLGENTKWPDKPIHLYIYIFAYRCIH